MVHHLSERESRITVVLADAHPLFLGAMSAAVDADDAISLVGTARDGPTALTLIGDRRPAVAVIDLDLPGHDGRDLTRRLRQRGIKTRVLIIAHDHSGEIVLDSLTAGAAGFVSKNVTAQELVAAVVEVAAGRSVLPDDVGPALAAALRQQGESDQTALTPRETEILQHIAQGESAVAIAMRLNLALATIKTHIQNLYVKLDAHDRGSAVATAIRRGLIE